MMNLKRDEYGQAMILFVFALVGLLGFTALALDGGMLYSDRRIAQNAADSASMSGAGAAGVSLKESGVTTDDWVCTDDGSIAYDEIVAARNKAVLIAVERAKNNDFEDGIDSNQVTVTTTCSTGTQVEEMYIDVEVQITTQTRPSLIHLVYSGPLVNTVKAVSRVRTSDTSGLFEGSAIVGLKPDGCDVVRAGGTPDTRIHNGDIYVNSSDPSCAFRQHGSATVKLDNGSINVVGGASYDPDDVDADVNENQTSMQIPYHEGIQKVEMPAECDPGNPATVVGDTIYPGYWSGSNFPPNGVTKLGDYSDNTTKIFCVDYDDGNLDNAYQINAGTEIWGHNVFVYVKNGGVHWNGNATVNLDAPDEGKYQGLLLYVDPHNYAEPLPNETVTINGKSGSTVVGTIFAPASHCKLNGTGDVGGYRVQAICYTIELLGNGLLDINYNPNDNYQPTTSPNLELRQ